MYDEIIKLHNYMRTNHFFILLAWMCAVTLGVRAQEGEQEFFVFDHDDPTIITGLTDVFW